MSSDAGFVSFALLPRPEWRSEARARRPQPAAAGEAGAAAAPALPRGPLTSSRAASVHGEGRPPGRRRRLPPLPPPPGGGGGGGGCAAPPPQRGMALGSVLCSSGHLKMTHAHRDTHTKT